MFDVLNVQLANVVRKNILAELMFHQHLLNMLQL